MQGRSRALLTTLVVLATGALAVELDRSAPAFSAVPAALAVVTAAVVLLLFSPVTAGRRERATHMTFGETAAVLAYGLLPPACNRTSPRWSPRPPRPPSSAR